MSILFIVLPLAILLAIGGVAAFVWAARHGQFDDLETPALRVVTDDDEGETPALRATAPGSRGEGSLAGEGDC